MGELVDNLFSLSNLALFSKQLGLAQAIADLRVLETTSSVEDVDNPLANSSTLVTQLVKNDLAIRRISLRVLQVIS